MNRSPFVLPELYTRALEAVLGIPLTPGVTGRSKDREWKKLVAAVGELSQQLTIDRSMAQRGDYLNDDTSRRAYRLYYMTTNFFKLWPGLRELSHVGFFNDSERKLTHLDLGSGPGTAIWSVALWLQEECGDLDYEWIATDIFPANLEDARTFGNALFNSLNARPHGKFEPLDISDVKALRKLRERHGKFRLVTMMNALNEIGESLDEAFIAELMDLLEDDGALILVEPSSREISRRALRFHDKILDLGFHIFSPCTHALRCPALLNAGDWCHTEIPWERPEFIRRIDDEIGTLRLSLKSTYFIIRKSPGNIREGLSQPIGITARVVSELFDEKGRYRSFLCSERGREEFVLNKRDLSTINESFSSAARYDLVSVQDSEVRPHDVKLTALSTYVTEMTSSGARNVDK